MPLEMVLGMASTPAPGFLTALIFVWKRLNMITVPFKWCTFGLSKSSRFGFSLSSKQKENLPAFFALMYRDFPSFLFIDKNDSWGTCIFMRGKILRTLSPSKFVSQDVSQSWWISIAGRVAGRVIMAQIFPVQHTPALNEHSRRWHGRLVLSPIHPAAPQPQPIPLPVMSLETYINASSLSKATNVTFLKHNTTCFWISPPLSLWGHTYKNGSFSPGFI